MEDAASWLSLIGRRVRIVAWADYADLFGYYSRYGSLPPSRLGRSPAWVTMGPGIWRSNCKSRVCRGRSCSTFTNSNCSLECHHRSAAGSDVPSALEPALVGRRPTKGVGVNRPPWKAHARHRSAAATVPPPGLLARPMARGAGPTLFSRGSPRPAQATAAARKVGVRAASIPAR